MDNTFATFVIGLAAVGVSGFVAWAMGAINSNRRDIATLRLHISENYMRKDDIKSLEKDVKELGYVIFEIAGKLGIPTRKE